MRSQRQRDRDETETKPVAPRSKKQALQGKTKRRGGGGRRHDSDDDSVDSRGNIRGLIDYDYESSDSDSSYSPTSESELSEVEQPRGRRKAAVRAAAKIRETAAKEAEKPAAGGAGRKASKKKAPKDESSMEEEDTPETSETSEETPEEETLEETSEEETDEDDDEDEMEEEGKFSRRAGGIILTLGAAGESGLDTMIPRRHNMKKEPALVRKFVDLLTKPVEDNSIDAQIDQFKALPDAQQNELVAALERRPTMTDKGVNLMLRILTLKLAPELQAMILAKYNALQEMDPSAGEYFKIRNWLDKIVSVPFGLYKDLPVKLDDGSAACEGFMRQAKAALDSSTYGQDEPKLQILQFISAKVANPENNGTSLLLVGPPGIGKTTLIKNGIAKALGWPFQFISLGGDSDASTYTGHQVVYEGSHTGKIVNSLIAAKSMSCVMLFDELDKISATPKGEEVQNILIHLTDPAANTEFEDKYLAGVPMNLSKVMFVFTANDLGKIDKVLLDRMNVVVLKGYDHKQKLAIAENYLLPAALRDVNLVEKVAIGREVIEHVIAEYASEEKGVRQLKRCLEQIAQKLNMLRMYNAKELPFYIKDFTLPFIMKKEHVSLFLKKSEIFDGPPPGMYT
jgi:ATP-dependent Lon protease